MEFSDRNKAIIRSLLVTFLWSTSWILIKYSIHEIPPITFAGLRYSIAVLFLIPGTWNSREKFINLEIKDWGNLAILGLVFYAFTQGGQFFTLKYLEATTFSLLLNFTSVIVAILSYFTTRERPSQWQWIGIMTFLVGVYVFFFQSIAIPSNSLGIIAAGITVFANSIASLIGRSINKKETIPPNVVTIVSMGVGAITLLCVGLVTEGIPALNLSNIAIIVWLAAVNTAFAFTLWNKSLQILTAVESSIINSSMLIQITILAWIFLDEEIGLLNLVGLSIAFIGLLLTNKKSQKYP